MNFRLHRLNETPRRLRRLQRFKSVVAALALALSCSNVAAAANDGAETRAPLPFEPTEQLVYVGEFSKLLLRGIKIAEFRFTASRAEGDAAKSCGEAKEAAAPCFTFVGDVTSEGWFHKLFNIDFHFRIESLVERDTPTTLAAVKTTKLDEQGRRVRKSEAVFDRAGKKISWTEVDPTDPTRPPRVVNTPLEGAAHDILSAIYFLRTQPLAPGRSFELTLSDSGQVYRVPATVVAERKQMKTVLGKVSVVRLDVGLFGEGRPVDGEGKMSLWVTTDARRVPVRARMSSNIGMIDIKLKKFSTNPAAEPKSR